MKRLRLERWSGQLLSQSCPRPLPSCSFQLRPRISSPCVGIGMSMRNGRGRFYSSDTGTAVDLTYEDESPLQHQEQPTTTHASPPPSAALLSAKLAALHARLSLPKKLPVETLARTLVDPSAHQNTQFNNSSLAQVGEAIISYYVSEWLVCHYPRLPMTVLFSAAYAYHGPKTLSIIAEEWGVESAAYPGSEVDAGLLQFSKLQSGQTPPIGGPSIRPDKEIFWRRGISSRNVYDDEFGDLVPKENTEELPKARGTAYAGFVKAVVGAIYLHAGRKAAKDFVQQHILSRHLAMSGLFAFKEPVRELARLCQREEFEYPVARILSETGRNSRSPVFVVGIYSGDDKLGEGAAPSLLEARVRASVAALKGWYLYSPGRDTRVPSEMEDQGAKEWEPVHIDLGEIIH